MAVSGTLLENAGEMFTSSIRLESCSLRANQGTFRYFPARAHMAALSGLASVYHDILKQIGMARVASIKVSEPVSSNMEGSMKVDNSAQ